MRPVGLRPYAPHLCAYVYKQTQTAAVNTTTYKFEARGMLGTGQAVSYRTLWREEDRPRPPGVHGFGPRPS